MSTAMDTGALLEAGALLAPGTHRGQDADGLTARAYIHPALDERPVVRLVGETLAEAEDLALEFLGLERRSVAAGLGQVRRETLGFPAWALVHDPANGHHALALVKDVERLGRMARSRAGAAKEGFEELGERLGRSVPHFLPTFYEQAGRCFLQHGNTGYAAVFFGKAREVERVHSLPVDEDRQRAVFLEFAFAGALTVKALKDHVRDLTQRLSPSAAWEQYRRLTVERCTAGLPPYAALPQDARRLIKAAKLDRAAEECALLAELLATPAVGRAPASFWTAYRETLVELAEREPAVRRRLLELVPTGFDNDNHARDTWLGILAETGADTLLTDPRPDPAVGAAAWLTRWAAHLQGGWHGTRRSPATYDLVRAMAPRLRAEGRPVDVFHRRYWRISCDLDLADVCLSEGIALADPPTGLERGRFGLDDWFGGSDEGRQPLEAVGGDPRFVALLRQAVADGARARGGNRTLHAIVGHPVLRRVFSEWLADRADALCGASGLPGIRSVLNEVSFARHVAADLNPAAVDRIRRHDVVQALARTLRAGLMDELGWPALDEAMRILGPRGQGGQGGRGDWQTVQEAWPALIVARRHKAVVVGPEGILLEHDLRLPDSVDRYRQPDFHYVDGELLVSWWDSHKPRAYWSARPAEVFAPAGDSGYGRQTRQPTLPLPGGGRTSGARPLHAGDTALPKRHHVISDGRTYWRLRETSTGSSWTEYEPATGAGGRSSLPALLADAVRDGSELLHASCQVLPLHPGLEGTPLGTDGAQLGHWVRADGDHFTAGTPDGTTVTMAPHDGLVPLGALRLPGGAAPVLASNGHLVCLFRDGAASGEGSLAHAAGGHRGDTFAAGTDLVPPAAYWHALRPRDEAGSQALRDLTDRQAAELFTRTAEIMDAFREQPGDPAGHPRLAPSAHLLPPGVLRPSSQEPAAKPDERAATLAVVEQLLPAVTHPALRAGIASIVCAAVQVRRGTERFTDPEQPAAATSRTAAATDMFEDYEPEHGDDMTVLSACRSLLGVSLGNTWSSHDWTVLRQIRAAGHVLAGRPATGKPLPTEHDLAALTDGWTSDPLTAPVGYTDWPALLDHLPALAYHAAAQAVDEEERAGLLLLLDALAEGPLTELGGSLRRVVLREPDRRKKRAGQVLRCGGRTVMILAGLRFDTRQDEIDWLAVDLDPSRAFGPVAHFTTVEARPAGAFPAARLRALTGLVRERGPAPWRPEAVEELAQAPGAGRAQAMLLLAGCPGTERFAATTLVALTGLKSTSLAHGNDRLTALDGASRLAVLGALLPQDPAALWEDGPDTRSAVREWTDRFGALVRLPEDLDVSFHGIASAEAVEAVLNPARTPWLSRTTTQRPDQDGRLTAADPRAVPQRHTFVSAVRALGQLAYELPAGHPLRAALPGALDAVRRRLADPALLLDLGLEFTGNGTFTAAELRKVYGLPETGGAGADGLVRAGEAFVLVPWYQDRESVLLRPAGLTGADDPAFALVAGLTGGRGTLALQALRAVLSSALERAVADSTAAGFPHDPTRAVPQLVAEAAKEYELSEDAAALYLQLLALPDPTDRNCAKWTGWKPARLKKARAELTATDLVVEAKRARAGRSLFLPGGWEALKNPALPVETWKRGHLPFHEDMRMVPMEPVAELFETAWQRVRGGDRPAFEELTTRATRKGRR
ncbi:hypothetical protein ACFQLX_06585 [Streptomyces polyrhachis]|uniref:DNA-binding protein n=1 Tax=Streptomyces polyrhachis TaxID=1282885 RepID=A0ABW2GEM3_9ACTN